MQDSAFGGRNVHGNPDQRRPQLFHLSKGEIKEGSMGRIQTIFSSLAAFFKLITDPKGVQAEIKQQIKEMQDLERETLKKRYGSLDMNPKPPDQIRRFLTLEEGIDFLAGCLERDAPLELAAEMESLQDHLAYDPDYALYFTQRIFLPLQEIHEEYDMRSAVAAEDQARALLYHPDFWLRGLNIEFHKRPQGWVIRDAFITRG
jgi:hypothetical protein